MLRKQVRDNQGKRRPIHKDGDAALIHFGTQGIRSFGRAHRRKGRERPSLQIRLEVALTENQVCADPCQLLLDRFHQLWVSGVGQIDQTNIRPAFTADRKQLEPETGGTNPPANHGQVDSDWLHKAFSGTGDIHFGAWLGDRTKAVTLHPQAIPLSTPSISSPSGRRRPPYFCSPIPLPLPRLHSVI